MLNLAQARLADQMQQHPEQIATFNHITSLIEEVRRCWTPVDYRILQQRLSEHIERVDALAEEASTRRKRCEEQQRRLPYQKNLHDPNAAKKNLHRIISAQILNKSCMLALAGNIV